MNHKNIAIFGSTGHVAKNLISFFSKDKTFDLFLFSRDPTKSKTLSSPHKFSFRSYDEFEKNEYDVIINCIGVNVAKFTNYDPFHLIISEFYDNKIINYLKNHSTTLYLNLSSGAIFGQDFISPVNDFSIPKLDLNEVNQGTLYSSSKIYSEFKHRSFVDFNIVDLRIFGFFSKFIDLNTNFFMSELIKSVKNKSNFITNNDDIIRDYVNPSDFYNLVKCCISNKKINDAFDVYSKEPISKFQILKEFSDKFDLKFKLIEKLESISETGLKKNYYSLSRKAKKIDYFPQFSSLETILNESALILKI